MKPLILSIPSYAHLAEAIAHRTGWEQGEVERKTFQDGERYQRLQVDVRERDVVLVAGTASDADTLQAYDLACAIARYGAGRLTWVCPYFGYQTQERSSKPGEVVTAKTRARLISAIPQTARGNRILLLDLHTAGIPYYFGDGMHAFHLYAKNVVLSAARAFGGDDFVLAAPDAGRAKWVQSLARDLGVGLALVSKERLGDGEVRLTGIDAKVSGRTVVIYDDMIRTGGTLLNAARAYRDAGAAQVYAVATHLVLPGDAKDRILDSGLFAGLAGTDSHPRTQSLADDDRITIRSVAPIFADWLTA